MQSAILVLCTCPDAAAAERIGKALIEARLAACANVVPGLTSIYAWQGEIARDAECLLVLKTLTAAYEALEKRLVALHPYELPEVIAVPISEGYAAYLNWIGENVALV
jgi:periplasmic divalent cation tolerance protein